MTYRYVTSAQDLPAIANEISGVVSMDLETTGFSPFDSNIRIVSLNTGKGVYVIDIFKTGTPYIILEALRREPAIKVGQHLKFEQKFLLHKHALELGPIFDTYRASALIYNGKLGWKHDLFSLYRRELNMEPRVGDLAGSDWSGTLTKEQLDYAADDVIHLPALRDSLRAKLITNGLVEAAKIEFDAILPESAMELNGFYLDRQSWLDLAAENAVQAAHFKDLLLAELPHPRGQLALLGMQHDLNLQSPDQLLASLHRMRMMVPDTSEATLAMWSDDFPIVKTILDYREFAQCVKAFGPKYLSNINPLTGRIHQSLFPFTGCGRYASSKPNLQQIPRKKRFRQCFKAPPGRALVVKDYSQIELRIAAEMANDDALMGVYIRGEDAHSQTASLISNVAMSDVTKDMRDKAKAINFGLIYGMAADTLVVYAKKNYGVSLSPDEAHLYHTRYFEAYYGIRRWHQEVFAKRNRNKGITRTLAGSLRYLDPQLYNEFANTPVQGTAAYGLKRSLPIVYQRTKDIAKMVHCVHDEIVLECDDDPEVIAKSDAALESAMVEGMQKYLRRVPVIVQGGSGSSWAEK